MKTQLVVVAAVTLVSPQALGAVNARRFVGALIHPTAVFLQASSPSGSETPVEQMTREQLQAELADLGAEKPSLGGPIALTAVGGVLTLGAWACIGLGLTLVVGSASEFATAWGFVIAGVGVVAGIVGAVLLIVGLVKLFTRLGERRTYQQRIDDVKARLEAIDREAPAPPPPPSSFPDAPPGAGFQRLTPGLVVARF
jgi:hypothetical protein